MKTVNLSNTTDADDYKAIAIEVMNILCSEADEDTDFEADGENIDELDLTEKNDPIAWSIDRVYSNEDGTASRVEIDC